MQGQQAAPAEPKAKLRKPLVKLAVEARKKVFRGIQSEAASTTQAGSSSAAAPQLTAEEEADVERRFRKWMLAQTKQPPGGGDRPSKATPDVQAGANKEQEGGEKQEEGEKQEIGAAKGKGQGQEAGPVAGSALAKVRHENKKKNDKLKELQFEGMPGMTSVIDTKLSAATNTVAGATTHT